MEQHIHAIDQLVEELLSSDPACFLIEVRVKPTNNIKVYIDGDQGFTIEKCIAVNRALYKRIEEKGWFPDGDFSLEVSSPGLDEPLKNYRQYVKNTGRPVEVILNTGTKVEGVMAEVTPEGIVVEETKGKNKKKEVLRHSFPFNNIKTTKLQVVFKNAGATGA